MRDAARIPRILEAIRVEWERDPDLRLGQLIMNSLPVASDSEAGTSLFYMEDAALVAHVQGFIRRRKKPAKVGNALDELLEEYQAEEDDKP